MALYEFRCSEQHVTSIQRPIAEGPPASPQCETPGCDQVAHRLFSAPAAIHFKGPGFYSTDVKSRVERKRRPNPGDDLPKPFDRHAAAVAADSGVRR